MAKKIGIVLALDGEQQFSQGMKNATESTKRCDQELKNLKEEFKDSANSMEALTRKEEALKTSQDAYKRALDQAKNGQKHAIENYKKCGKALEDLEKDLSKAEKELKDMEKAGDTSSKSYKDQKKAVEDLQTAVGKQRTEYAKAEGNITRWDTKVSKAEADLKKNSKAVDQNAKYLDEAKNSANGCATSIDRFGKEVRAAGDDAGQAGEGVKSLGEQLKEGAIRRAGELATEGIKALGQKAVEAAKYAVEVGSEFEASMSKVEALSGATGKDLDDLSAKAQELGRTTQYSASEAADALGNMALAGWNTNEMLTGIDGVLNLAAASGMDLASAADAVAGYLAAFNMKASESGKLADIMATAQAKSKTTADQLSEAYGTCATNMTQTGQSVETTTALLEGLASVNDTGSAAGTKLSAVMAQITKKMKDGAIQIGETKVAVTNEKGEFRDMVDILEDVEKATADMTDEERNAALQRVFNRQSMAGMNELLSVGSTQLRTYKTDLENSTGAAEAMAGTMNDNFKGAIKEAGSAAEGLGIAVYNQVSGPLTDAVRIATGAINGITDAITPQKTEMDYFLEEIQSLNEAAESALTASRNALSEGEQRVTEIDALAGIIEDANEQFGIFADTDTSGVISDTEKTARDAGSNLDDIKTAAGEAAEAVSGLGEAEVTAPESLETAKSEISEGFSGIGEDVDGAKEKLGELGDASVSAPGSLDEAKSEINTGLTEVQDDVDSTTEKLGELGEVEITAPDTSAFTSSMQEAAESTEAAASSMDTWTEYRVKNAIQELAQTIPELSDAWDDQTKHLKITKDEFDSLIENQKMQIRAMAIETAKTDAVVAQTKAALVQKMAQDSLDNIIEKAQEVSGKTIESISDLQALADEIRNSWNEATPTGTAAEIIELADSAKEADTALSDANETLAKSDEEMEAVELAADALADEYGITAAEIIKNAAANEENADAASGAADAMDEETDAAEKLAEAEKEVAAAGEKAAETIRSAFESAKQSIENTFKTDLGSEWDGGLDQTVEQMVQNLNSQIEGMQNYAQNLEIVKDHVGKEIAPEFMQYLEGMGKDGANILAHIAKTFEQDNGAEVVQSLSDKYIESLNMSEGISTALAADQVAMQIGLNNFGSSDQEWSGLTDAAHKAAEKVKNEGGPEVSFAVMEAFESAIENARAAGVAIPEGLTEGIETSDGDAEGAIEHATDVLNSALEGQGSAVLEMAKEVGANIPAGYEEAMEAGGSDAVAAMQTLLDNISEKASDAKAKGEEVGKETGAGTASGMESKSGEVKTAGETLGAKGAEGAKGKESEYSNAGKAAGTQYSTGLSSSGGTVFNEGASIAILARTAMETAGGFDAAGSAAGESYASGISSQGGNAYNEGASLANLAQTGAAYAGGFDSAGSSAGSSFVSGLSGQSGSAYAAGSGVAGSARSGASGVGGFSSIGYNMMAGVASGIYAGRSGVVNAAVSVVNAAAQAAKNAAQIKSPSRRFRDEVGKMIGKGIAQGIKITTKDTADAAEAQMNTALSRLVKWVNKNKRKIGDTSDISYAWMKLADKEVKNHFGISDKKTTGSGNNKKTVKKSASEYADEIYRAAQQYMRNVQAIYDVSDKEQLDYWERVVKGLSTGTQAWFDAQAQIKSIKEKIKEDAAEAKAEAKRAAKEAKEEAARKKKEEAAAAKKAAQEKARKEKEQRQKEKQAAQEAAKKAREQRAAEIQAIKDARAKILSDAQDYVSRQKALNKMSTSQEIAYWEKTRKRLKQWTDEWKTATRNIQDLKQNFGTITAADSLLSNYKTYYDMSLKAEAQYWDIIRKKYKTGTEDRIAADQKFLDAKAALNNRLKEIEDDYAQKITDANQRYKDALQERKDEILSAFDLFDAFESTSASGKELLFNIQSQAAGYQEWSKSLDQLRTKGILSDDLMDELTNKGPEAIASIKALLTLNNAELKAYQKAYDTKEKAATAQAKKDTADLKAEVAKEVADLKAQRTKELAEVKKTINTDIKTLASNIKSIADDQTAALVAAFRTSGSSLQYSTGTSVSKATQQAAGVQAVVSLAAAAVAYEKKLAAAQKAVTSAQAAVDKAQAAVTAAQTKTANAKKALDTAKKEQSTVKADKKSTSAQKKEAQEKVTKATATYNTANTALTKAKSNLKTAQTTLKTKQNELTKLKKQGFRTGTKYLTEDGLIWMDEELSRKGPEMIVRKSDNAILTRAKAGDSIIPANLANNLFKWGAIDPESISAAAMSTLNSRLLEGYKVQAAASGKQVEQLAQMLELMTEFMPYMAQRMTVPIQSRDAVAVMSDDISRNMAARFRRTRR